MNVLSLFDGISCGRVALERAGIQVDNYYASEIESAAMKISNHNYKDIVQVGDITKLSYKDGWLSGEFGTQFVGQIDIVIGGSPCQSISKLGDGSGLEGKSGLFYHFKRVRDEVSPKYWLLENVEGNKEAIKQITAEIGGELHRINSNTVSAQNRKRLYWTNIPDVKPPSELGTKLVDVLESDPSPESKLTLGRLRWLLSDKGKAVVAKKYATINPEKAGCLTARSDASWNCNYIEADGVYRKLSCVEYERLQTLPDNYTAAEGVLNSARYRALGNGWTVDVIAHILGHINK